MLYGSRETKPLSDTYSRNRWNLFWQQTSSEAVRKESYFWWQRTDAGAVITTYGAGNWKSNLRLAKMLIPLVLQFFGKDTWHVYICFHALIDVLIDVQTRRSKTWRRPRCAGRTEVQTPGPPQQDSAPEFQLTLESPWHSGDLWWPVEGRNLSSFCRNNKCRYVQMQDFPSMSESKSLQRPSQCRLYRRRQQGFIPILLHLTWAQEILWLVLDKANLLWTT